MSAHDLVPEGWMFHAADFSIQASAGRGLGSVTLVRDADGRALWSRLPDSVVESSSCPDLYVSGQGETLEEAIGNAAKKATPEREIHDAIHAEDT